MVSPLYLFCVLLLCKRVFGARKGTVYNVSYNKTGTGGVLSCDSLRLSSRVTRRKMELENNYRQQHQQQYNGETASNLHYSKEEKVTLLFGHVHHAGGTAFCLLARNNTAANPKDNCNHPYEFQGPIAPPTRGSIAQQVDFQRVSPWQFYAVELHMPRHLKYNGPFVYGVVLRNPYLLLVSQYRRSQIKFKFKGDLIDLVHLQLKYVNITTVDFRSHMALQQHQREHHQNYFRGQAAFILGQFGATNHSDSTIANMAKRRLRRFSVIALTEHMMESGAVLSATLNWRVEGFGQKEINSSGSVDDLVSAVMSLSADDKTFLRYYCRVDVILYRYARCLLSQKYFQLTNTTFPSDPFERVFAFFDTDLS